MAAQAMRFKPWMLAPQSKTKAGPWSALPPSVLAALTSTNPSPMARGYMINGSWPGATGIQPVSPEPEPESEPKQEPEATPTPELTVEPSPTDEASSLSLTIRVVQPEEEETTPSELPPKSSTWRRFLRAIKGDAA